MTSDFMELIRSRRSVRKFTADPVSAEHIALLKETAMRSPTSRNLRPWQFIFVTDPARLAILSECKPHGAAFLSGAALGIVVCANETQSDVWIEDCSVASILLQFTAQSLGLGSCWLQVRRRKTVDGADSETYVRNVLALPESLRVLSIIGVGHPAETPDPVAEEDVPAGPAFINPPNDHTPS